MSAADIDSKFEGDSGLIVDNDGERKQQTDNRDKDRWRRDVYFIVQILITNMSSQLFVHTEVCSRQLISAL